MSHSRRGTRRSLRDRKAYRPSAPSDDTWRARIWRRAVELHRRDCPGDAPLDTRSLGHRLAHENEAMLVLRREQTA